MKKKILWITSIVLVLIISVSTVAVCVEIKQKNEGESDRYYSDDTVISQKLYTAPDGEQIVLTYLHSSKSAKGNPLHYYQDAEGNQYYFNADGDLVGHKQSEKTTTQSKKESETSKVEQQTENESPKVETPVENKNPKTETQTENTQTQVKPAEKKDPPTSYITNAPATPEEQAIIDKARAYAEKTYGKEYFSKFSYTRMLTNEAIKTNDVFFYIRYKERIVTECCIVTLYQDKTLGSDNAIISGKGTDAAFDPNLLNNVEIEELEQFAAQKVKEKYGDNYVSHTTEEDIAVVRNDNGGFDLCVVAKVTLGPNTSKIREKTYYPLG